MTRHRWVCPSCGAHHSLAGQPYTCTCPAAGRLRLALDPAARPVTPDPADPTLWRYVALLPFAASSPAARRVRATFPAGGTPLVGADRLAELHGLARLWIKDEATNPTGSLKDRAAATVVAAALTHGHEVVATASTGNAAAALAGAAAACGLRAVLLVPARAGTAKLAQLDAYGARVVRVDGDYDTAVRLSFAVCDAFGWYCRTTAVNPYTTQGKKTVALEMAEQLGGTAPDAVVVPAGDGNIVVGLYEGFRDALALGLLDRMPRLVAVQAAGAAAIYEAWRTGASRVSPRAASTAADGICVGEPLDGDRALAAVRDTGGLIATVTDAEMQGAARRLAAEAGVAAELSSAAGAAALPALRATGVLTAADRVVLVNTGGGVAVRSAAEPDPPGDLDMPGDEGLLPVPATVDAVRAVTADLPRGNGPRLPRWTLSGISVT